MLSSLLKMCVMRQRLTANKEQNVIFFIPTGLQGSFKRMNGTEMHNSTVRIRSYLQGQNILAYISAVNMDTIEETSATVLVSPGIFVIHYYL